MAQTRHVTSTGHQLSDAAFLDLHFEVNRQEYTQLVKDAGFEPGWQVLDAGCGAGSFLPLIHDQIGPEGKLSAIDLAPENVETTRERVERWGLSNVVEIREASVFNLPFDENTFDAVWCANVSQYLTDDEFDRTLQEFVRVTRPEGLIAIKETSGTFSVFQPAPPAAKQLLIAAAARDGGISAAGVLRDWKFHQLLKRAGLVDVHQQTILAELRAPLNDLEHLGMSKTLSMHAELASELTLPAEYRDFWEKQRDPESSESILNRPDFYFAEGLTLATGRVPVR
ncbi:MAG: class I SAM-dependent methyltransferase [Thermomicrobiales bacterium]